MEEGGRERGKEKRRERGGEREDCKGRRQKKNQGPYIMLILALLCLCIFIISQFANL